MFPFYNNPFSPFPLIPSRNRRPRTIDNRGIYEICTTGVVENTAGDTNSVDYGINPCTWKSLPNEFVAVWKVRHPVTTAGADLPVNVIIPSGNTSTVNSSNSNPSTSKLLVVDNKNTQTTGKDINTPVGSGSEAQQGYTTEHWIYVNKCTGTFRLMGVTAQETVTPVS